MLPLLPVLLPPGKAGQGGVWALPAGRHETAGETDKEGGGVWRGGKRHAEALGATRGRHQRPNGACGAGRNIHVALAACVAQQHHQQQAQQQPMYLHERARALHVAKA